MITASPRLWAAVALPLLVAALLAWPHSGQASAVNAEERIVFTSFPYGGPDVNIAALDPNDLSVVNLTSDTPATDEYYSALSPDGTRIAFTRDLPDGSQIFVTGLDGSVELNVSSREGAYAVGPDYSHDGTQIVFMSDPFTGHEQDIWVVGPDGSNPMNLTTDHAPPTREPSFAPDGKIAFNSDGDIFRMNGDGSNPVNLTNTDGFYEIEPDYSPDGKRIAFAGSSAKGPEEWHIYVMDADGSNRRRITEFRNTINPAFSPDGTQVAFVNRVGDTIGDLWVIGVDGSNGRNLTAGYDEYVLEPNWGRLVEPAASCSGDTATVAGTEVGEQLPGTADKDVMTGGTGDDTVVGGEDKDTLCGGGESNSQLALRVAATTDDDSLIGEQGRDVMKGGSGNDLLKGGKGRDKLVGGPGEDRCVGGRGKDRLKKC